MDPRNYTTAKQKRVKLNSGSDDVNETDIDFDIELANDEYVKVIDNIYNQKALDNKKVIKVHYSEDNESKEIDDLVADKFDGVNKFTFILELNDFHKYKYEIKLKDNNQMTFRRMYKIICQSAEPVLQDSLNFVKKAQEKMAKKAKNKEERAKAKLEKEKEKHIGGGLFDVEEKLNELEIEVISVNLADKKFFVRYSGFEPQINPRKTL
jgi:hypothetical protein